MLPRVYHRHVRDKAGKILKTKRYWRWLLIVVAGLPLLYAVGRTLVQYQGGIYHGARAPYLQLPSPQAITVRWQTATSEKGVVLYGASPGQWQVQAEEGQAREEHEVRLRGLQAATRYYYAVGSSGQIHYGDDASRFFETPPLSGADVPVRLVVLGDPGEATRSAAPRDAMQAWLQQHPRPNRNDFDLLLVTGDLAYSSGSNPQFQENFFTPYQHWLQQVPIWPTYGNHDSRRFAYFKIFSLPTAAESGGVASRSEHYYSFDYGPVHVVVLDSEDTWLGTGGDMYHWLQRDLAATQQPWLIAMFHHPPYTKGSHDSDRWRDSWGRLFAMRENFLPLLEQHGADLVLSGHSHMYERSYLLRCHYGTSDTLHADMIADADPASRYSKPAARLPFSGTIYNVVGSSARLDNGPLNHPVMAASLQQRGNLVIDITDKQLQAYFINEQGSATDQYSLRKDKPQPVSMPAGCP